MSSGDKFNLKCRKCGVWYDASCQWHTEFDRQDYVLRDKAGKPMPWKDADGKVRDEPIVAMLPRVIVSSVEPHKCKAKGKPTV